MCCLKSTINRSSMSKSHFKKDIHYSINSCVHTATCLNAKNCTTCSMDHQSNCHSCDLRVLWCGHSLSSPPSPLNSGLVICLAEASPVCQFEQDWLLCAAARARLWSYQPLGLLSFGLVVLGGIRIDHKEGGGEEAQEGAAWGHHWDGSDAPHSIHHCAQCWRHKDLSDVDLAWQNGTVNAKASPGVPRTVVDVLWVKTENTYLII